MESVRAKLDWFKAVILPHEASLRAYLRRIVPRYDELDDIVAEVMTRTYATTDFERVTAGRAYIFRIARNLIIDEARRARIASFEEITSPDLIADHFAVDDRLIARDQLRRLEAIIESLPAQCRRAFILRKVHDKPVREIAEEMGLSVFTVDKHIGRAMVKVMQAIGQFEELGFGWSLPQRQGKAGDRGKGGPPLP